MLFYNEDKHVINLEAPHTAVHTNVINYRRLWLELNLKKDYWMMLKREIRIGEKLLKGLLMSLPLNTL